MEFIPGLEENTNKGGELACDIDNVTTISFTPTTSKSEIRKEDIADFGDEGFLLYDVLSREESNLIMSEGEKIGFERMKGVKDEYRSAQRSVLCI